MKAWVAGVAAAAVLGACGSGGRSGDSSSKGLGPPAVIEETRSSETSSSPMLWVSSGALFFVNDAGLGTTVVGELPPDHPWRQEYARTNPRDTDGGGHPQNVFRLFRREILGNAVGGLTFRLLATNPSDSPERGPWSGVFLLHRFLGGGDFYAAGVRMDGRAVIKRKRDGAFTTLALRDLFGSPAAFDRNANPNLLPAGRPIRLDTRVETLGDGSVTLGLSVDGEPVLEATDPGPSAIRSDGFPGMASDFMDLEIRRLEARGF